MRTRVTQRNRRLVITILSWYSRRMKTPAPGMALMRQFGLAVTLLLSLMLSGCSEAPLKLGIHSWIGYDLIPMAQQWSWIGPDIELIVQKSAEDSLSGLASGELQAACLTLDEVIRGLDQGLPLRIIAVMNVSSGADSLLVRPDISSIAELRGERVALQTSGSSMLMLAAALEAGGLTLADVERVDTAPHQLPGLWQSGDVAAIATHEPHARTLRNIGAITLLSSRDTPELFFDVVAVRTDAITGRKKALKSLVGAILKAQAHVHDNPIDTVYRLASLRGNPVEFTEADLRKVVIPTLESQHGYFDTGSSLLAAVARINALFINAGMTSTPESGAGLLNPDFLPALTP